MEPRTWNLVRVPGWPRSPGSWTWPAGTRRPSAGANSLIPAPSAPSSRPRAGVTQVFITNSADADIVYLEVVVTAATPMSRTASKPPKALGLDHFPSNDFEFNAAWLIAVLIACDLTTWTQGLCLTGTMANAEPKKLRWAMWHTAGKITTTGRRQTLHLDVTWPWATHLAKRLPPPPRPPLHDLTQPTQRPAASPSEPPTRFQRITRTGAPGIRPTNRPYFCHRAGLPRSHRNSRQQVNPRLESLKVRKLFSEPRNE